MSSLPKHPERNQAVLDLLDAGMTQVRVALQLGLTKNIVAGIWARAGRGMPGGPPAHTLIERMNTLHARMDAVLAETRGVGKLPNEPKKNATKPLGVRYGQRQA